MTKLDSVLKSRNITLLTKLHIVKFMVFPVVMFDCESWTIKKSEHQRIDAFESWCWRGLLRVSWTARRSNPSILKEINSEYSLERLMLKLKPQYFGHLSERPSHWKRPWCYEALKAREGYDRGWDRWLVSQAQWANSRRWWRTRKPGFHGAVVHGISKSHTQLSDWTIT